MTGHGAKPGNMHLPDRCKVTVYHCCLVTVKPGSSAEPNRGHQCHEPPVKDGLCLKHLGDRIRLRQSLSQ